MRSTTSIPVRDNYEITGVGKPKGEVPLPAASRYRLGDCIGVGGTGSLHRGHQLRLDGEDRPVAIKRMHARVLAIRDARETILQQVAYAKAVNHPNVVAIEDVEQLEGELLVVMELVEGNSLAHLLKRRRLPISVAVAIVLDACEGLQGIHSARGSDGRRLGLVHRDISPQNILVGRDGRTRISDFAFTKAADPKGDTHGTRRGKAGYMAPEYILSGASSPSSDVFALGAVLWEALAGRRLFDGDTNADILRKNLATKVPSLHAENPEISPELDEVLQSALAHDASVRFASAAELGERLRAVVPSIATPSEVALEVGLPVSYARMRAASSSADVVFDVVKSPTSGSTKKPSLVDLAAVLEPTEEDVQTLVRRPVPSAEPKAGTTEPTPRPRTNGRILVVIALAVTAAVGVLAYEGLVAGRSAPAQPAPARTIER